MKRSLLGLLSVVILARPCVLSAAQSGDFYYSTDGSSVSIRGYAGSGGAVALPSTIDGLPVTSIGLGAFWFWTNLATVSIPGTITNIERSAFGYCKGLTSLTIPDSVIALGSQAFLYCTSLTNITLGNGLTSVASNTFRECSSLTSLAIPDSVTGVGDEAFNNCDGLTNLTLGYGVIRIGRGAFIYCSGLTNITIPRGVTEIGDAAFYGCSSLTAITAAEANPVYSSVDGVLFDKRQTTLLLCPQGKAGSYVVPNGPTRIAERAFLFCGHLAGVAIPNSVTNIADEAFMGCGSLTSVTIGRNVSSIGYLALGYCDNLTGVFFEGDAPRSGGSIFGESLRVTAYYLPGATGWGLRLDMHPTAPWVLPNPVILTAPPSFGVQTNQFGFIISWATNASVVVEACADLAHPAWSSVGTNTLSEGWSCFTDPQWTTHASRFYRVRSP